jgi:hypothetical protein
MRAREIMKSTRVDEGFAEIARDMYRNSDFAKNRAQKAATNSAQATFQKNISNLIARGILSGSIIQSALQPQQQAQQATPTANNPFPGSTPTPPSAPTAPTGAKGAKMPTANNPFPIKEAGPQPMATMANAPVSAKNSSNFDNPNSKLEFKPGAIVQTVNQYIGALARKYKWQDNPELKSNAERIAGEIEQKLSDPTVFKSIATAIQQKNPNAIAQIVQSSTADLTAQLFNTMYQWEQVGQTSGESEQVQRYQNQLNTASQWLARAAKDPTILQTDDGQQVLRGLGVLAQQANQK